MQELAPGYFAELSSQFAFLSAVLGGFAVTFLGTLLTLDAPRRVVSWAIGSAAVAAASFICGALAAAFLTVSNHPEAVPAAAAAAQQTAPRLVVAGALMFGIYALLLSLGLSGWARSRNVGLTTSLAAATGTVLATWILVGF